MELGRVPQPVPKRPHARCNVPAQPSGGANACVAAEERGAGLEIHGPAPPAIPPRGDGVLRVGKRRGLAADIEWGVEYVHGNQDHAAVTGCRRVQGSGFRVRRVAPIAFAIGVPKAQEESDGRLRDSAADQARLLRQSNASCRLRDTESGAFGATR